MCAHYESVASLMVLRLKASSLLPSLSFSKHPLCARARACVFWRLFPHLHSPPTPWLLPVLQGISGPQSRSVEARLPGDVPRDSPGTGWIPSPLPPSALHQAFAPRVCQ